MFIKYANISQRIDANQFPRPYVYSYGVSHMTKRPVSIYFDDEKYKEMVFEDAEKLTDILYRLEFNPRFDPDNILEIRGPDGDLFGYMFVAAGDLVSVKAAETNTVRLYYNPQRAPDAP